MTRRLLMISGSLRAGSTNSAALSTVVATVDDIEAVIYDGMAELPHFNPDDDHDPLPPAVQHLRAEIDRADAILFCTPDYAGGLPGSFKNVLDWTIGGMEKASKPVAWINVASPGRGIPSHDELRRVLTYGDYRIVEAACVQIPFTSKDVGVDGEVQDEQARAEIAAAVETLLADATAAAPAVDVSGAAPAPGGAGSR